MFGTKIARLAPDRFLRPETAQGLFVNFLLLLDYNNGRVLRGGADRFRL